MKTDGSPDILGEKRYQAGAVAQTIKAADGTLEWEITQLSNGTVRYTKCLAHADHWASTPVAMQL